MICNVTQTKPHQARLVTTRASWSPHTWSPTLLLPDRKQRLESDLFFFSQLFASSPFVNNNLGRSIKAFVAFLGLDRLKTAPNISIMRACWAASAAENHFLPSTCISRRRIWGLWRRVQTSRRLKRLNRNLCSKCKNHFFVSEEG